ncbi:MAG: energy transducer TonB, partial [Marinirhabdus sp.]|nr:energy transducer TonB [Marinirhabdus sp.]
YLFQEKLRTLHEFTADRLVAATNKSAYYQTLLSEVFGTTTISFVNTFYKSSLIKKRIVMLQKSNSKKIVQLKYLLLVPAICAMLFYTSCSEETESNNSEPNLAQYTYSLNMGEEMSKETEATHNAYESFLKANNEKYVAWVTHEEDVLTYSVHKRSEKVPATLSGPMKFDFQDGTSYDAYMQWPEGTRSETKISGSEFEIKDEWPTNSDEVPFAVIEKVPAYPGCEGSNEEVKKCTSKFIQTFVGENFNKNLANEVDLTGRQRISVQFKIDSEGYVGNVKARAAHPDLEAEAIRVVSKLPQMEPGESKGKKVSVIYSLPIIFQIDE